MCIARRKYINQVPVFFLFIFERERFAFCSREKREKKRMREWSDSRNTYAWLNELYDPVHAKNIFLCIGFYSRGYFGNRKISERNGGDFENRRKNRANNMTMKSSSCVPSISCLRYTHPINGVTHVVTLVVNKFQLHSKHLALPPCVLFRMRDTNVVVFFCFRKRFTNHRYYFMFGATKYFPNSRPRRK